MKLIAQRRKFGLLWYKKDKSEGFCRNKNKENKCLIKNLDAKKTSVGMCRSLTDCSQFNRKRKVFYHSEGLHNQGARQINWAHEHLKLYVKSVQ